MFFQVNSVWFLMDIFSKVHYFCTFISHDQEKNMYLRISGGWMIVLEVSLDLDDVACLP